MEKLILKKITLIISVIFIFVFFASSGSIIYLKNASVERDISEMINQVENSYKSTLSNIESTEKFFEDDYLNRAYAVDYILNNNPQENLNNKSLKKIKELMEVESIHIVDKNGKIVLSSDDDSIGINLLEHKESHPFWNLIKGNDTDGKVVQLNGISITSKKEKIYIGVETKLEDYSLIQISLDISKLDDLMETYSINYIINNSPTVYEKAVFAVNKNTGIIESITKNNEHDVVLENINSNEEFRDRLYDFTDGGIVKINNKYRYIKTKIVGDYIVGAYLDSNRINNEFLVDVVYLIIIMLIAFISVITVVKFSLKKYILKDIHDIEKNIEELIDGNYDVEFDTKYDTELKQVSNILNYWKDGYKHKSQRMTRIMSAINTSSATFECLYVINKNFFSDNMKELLGVDDETWEQISKRPEDFENYINSLNVKGGIVNINNKFLKIVSFKKEDEFYGMITDKTDDEEFKSEIKKKLETDPLTKLLNRRGLENRMETIFKENKEGILIIFDLDNFKRVNDELGHPIGDEVLKIFSKCLVSSFRTYDIISRMGGDEFIVFINKNISKDILCPKLDRVLNKIRTELKEYYDNYGLSTSIGIAYKNDKNNTYEKLYKDADEQLYKAKNLGKDRFYINIEDNN